MPGRDGTGPQGAYQNCMSTEGEPSYQGRGRGQGMSGRGQGSGRGRGMGRRGNQRRMPGTGGRGRGRMNRFYGTGQPGWQRDRYQVQQMEKESGNLNKLESLLEQILEKLENKE